MAFYGKCICWKLSDATVVRADCELYQCEIFSGIFADDLSGDDDA